MEDYVVTIGIFDGLHVGHKKIINETVNLAKLLNSKSMLMSFSNNPKKDNGIIRQKKILSDSLFKEIINELKVDKHYIIDFSSEISKISGRDFIQKLCSEYHVKALVVGQSFRCGYPPLSLGAYDLKTQLSVYNPNSDVKIVPPVIVDGIEVSSTALRKYISDGDFYSFHRFAGYFYILDLSGLSYEKDEDGFVYYLGTSVQIIPKDGKYRVYAKDKASFLSMSSPRDYDFKAVISDSGRCLKLYVPFKPANISFLIGE